MFDPANIVEGELYDLRADPGEGTNLLGAEGCSGVEERLRARLDEWKRGCEPTVDWDALRPPAGFVWSQQRFIEGTTAQRVASVWSGQAVVRRRESRA